MSERLFYFALRSLAPECFASFSSPIVLLLQVYPELGEGLLSTSVILIICYEKIFFCITDYFLFGE